MNKFPLITLCLFSLNGAFAQSGMMSENVFRVTPNVEEHCEETQLPEPHASLVEQHGRLIKELRAASKAADPAANLIMATAHFKNGNEILGNAYADLSVTGRRSFEQFRKLHENGQLNHELNQKALDRAYRVANALPFGNSSDRKDLGYIAISGEDDQPYRPVNMPSSIYPQYDMKVQVGQHVVNTRYMIAETMKDTPVVPGGQGHTLPRVQEPSLSADAKVLLFIHGMDSRLEEANDLFKSLQKIGKITGENWTIISMDLPTSGYADKLNHLDISPLSALGKPRIFPPGFNAHGKQEVPVLDFMEEFVISFVNTLDQKVSLKGKIHAAIGGSLGGNLTFRLGRRHDLPWLKTIVTWSPASIWHGLADGADIFKQIAVATGWKRSGGKKKFWDETPDKRSAFIKDAFGGAINIGPFQIVPAQPDQWWRRGWACFDNSRKNAELERYEIYNENFRRWHWRLGTEQLIYSQQKAPDLAKPRYLDNHINMLLACGTLDEFRYTNICSATRKTAERMNTTPGKSLIIEDTGHSIHIERPNYFSMEIVKFLKDL